MADKYDLLLLFDEIQVGLGRTGRKFAFEHENVVPDGLILGKALSGGVVPLSVFVTNSSLMDTVFSLGSDGSTFGGYPLACVAGIAALDVIEDENLVKRSAIQGAKLLKTIKNIGASSPHVKEVRGKGLFIGIEVKEGNAMKFCRELLKLGILANDSHGHTIRISPPLIISLVWDIHFHDLEIRHGLFLLHQKFPGLISTSSFCHHYLVKHGSVLVNPRFKVEIQLEGVLGKGHTANQQTPPLSIIVYR